VLEEKRFERLIFMESISEFDDTLPLPEEVEREFRDNAGDGLTAIAWLADHGVDSAPQYAALIQYGLVWNPKTGRYHFLIYGPNHVGPKCEPVLAVPVMEGGEFIDLLLMSDDLSFETATCRASWLGQVTGPAVRLHSHPMDWLEAGCNGVCHIAPGNRGALKDLRSITTMECNDVGTALQAWDWGFGGEDDALARFAIDDSPESIRCYFRDEADWRTAYLARESRA
jgi:hypothetical protein